MSQVIKIGKKWYSDFTHNGRRIRRALSPFKSEAELLLPDLVRQVRGDRPGDTKDISWNLYKAKYLEFSKANKSPNSLYRDERAFEMVDRFSNLSSLREMTPDLLETLKRKWQEDKAAPSTVTRSVKCIKTAMRRAEDLKYAPLQNWRIVKVEEPGGRLIHYDLAQFQKLLAVCAPPWKMAAMLMGRGGVRSGEAWVMEWPDVDFERRRIRIFSRPGWHIKGDKKGRTEKYVPLEPDLFEFLEDNRKAKGFLIDASGYGERMTRVWFLTRFKKFIRKAGLPGSPHALRHSCAAMMVSNGATLEEVAGVLGHKNLKTTMIYSHLSAEAKDRAINRLPRLFK